MSVHIEKDAWRLDSLSTGVGRHGHGATLDWSPPERSAVTENVRLRSNAYESPAPPAGLRNPYRCHGGFSLRIKLGVSDCAPIEPPRSIGALSQTPGAAHGFVPPRLRVGQLACRMRTRA
jgi:hypothetical protein